MKHCIFVVRNETKPTGTFNFRKENKIVIDLFFVCLGDTANPGFVFHQITNNSIQEIQLQCFLCILYLHNKETLMEICSIDTCNIIFFKNLR
jgi:hypothetical protein